MPPSKYFTVIASIEQEWNEELTYPSTKECQTLREDLEVALNATLHQLDGFIRVYIVRFFKGSIRFQSRVFFHKSSSVEAKSLSAEINNIDSSKFGAIEVIEIKNDEDRTSASQGKSKPSLEFWMIIVIAAGGVILIYTIILIVLLVGI